jgi:hypothetical protein
VIGYKQDPITESKYHNQIQHDYEKASHHQDGESEVRYWSDFNRLYYAPKTVQILPDIADWENAEGNWQEGRDTFKRFDEVHSSCLFSNFWMPIRPDIFHLAGIDFNGEFTSGFCRGMRHSAGTSLNHSILFPWSNIYHYLNHLQGIQLIHDTATFGSFIDSFLTSFQDEFSKLSVLSFDLLSDSLPASVDVNDVSA